MPGRRHRHFRRTRRRSISRSTRAELHFPVSRVDRLLREGHYAHRLSSATPVFLAGVLEYLTSNILELASEEAQSHHRMRITPEHVEKAVDNDQQLSLLFEDDTHLEMPPHHGK
ncbi:PREDICTED: histone H2A-Bbd type 1-like [Condylura cristata]|uniref:histone H2A-Bbd type 1-like n=1 Tax=Condylura cristata TaxID=143302 RepID=UPI0003345011|nr:PREDICTED: histone H2A-Bbd type 1-like [Condylura cristata]